MRWDTLRTVTKRDGSIVPFDKGRIAHVIKKAILAVEKSPKMEPAKEASLFADEVVKELRRTCAGTDSLHVERIQDAIVDVLHRDLARGASAYSSKPEGLWMSYMLYREGHILVRNGLLKLEHFHPDTRPRERLLALREWNEGQGILDVRGLNERFSKGGALEGLIKAAEERCSSQLADVASRIGEAIKGGGLRAIMITGPSSSGKTVTSRKALRHLSEAYPDVRFKPLEVDMYFRDNRYTEKMFYRVDGGIVEDVNFELPETYDISLLNEHLSALLRGETVMVPKYDFRTGSRTGESSPFRLEKNEVLLLDCMHALSPQLTEAIPAENKFKLYIEALSVLENRGGRPVYFTDVRLLRRMLRDVRTRGYPIPCTLWHWHLVRKGERFILPYVHSADMVIDSGIPYELPIFKHYLAQELHGLKPVFERNPDLFDGLARLRRILRLFRQLRAASSEQVAMVPKDSILREFIGGSEFFDK
jgi:uridine kinase